MTNFTLTPAIKLYTVLVMLYVAFALTCDILAYKVLSIFGYYSIAAALLFPLLYIFVDVITELFGGRAARFALLVHIICDAVFTFLTIYIIRLPSPSWWTHQAAFNTVIDPIGTLYIAGVIGTLSSVVLNIYLLSKWKVITNGRFFWARSLLSTAISIITYTVVTDLIAFKPFYTSARMLELMEMNLLSNFSFAVLYMPFAATLVNVVKRKIQINSEDTSPSFNPFSV